MDSGLAKVINSTVGTGSFKSLDEIFASDKSIIASDEIYQAFPSELIRSEVGSSNTLDICTFTFPLDGKVNLIYAIGQKTSSITEGDYTKLTIFKNNEIFRETQVNKMLDTENKSSTLLEGNKGDVFKIRITGSYTSTAKKGVCNLYSLNGTIVNGKTMNIQSLIS